MPTATAELLPQPRRFVGSTDAGRFVARAIAASLGLFALLRLPWTETHILLPMTRAQADAAVWLLGAPAAPVAVTLACSGSDALALCLAAIVAYPAAWRSRLAGMLAGVTLILILNTARIGTLGWAAGSPAWFTALHVHAWPALLTISIAGYIFIWMRVADRHTTLPAVAHPTRTFVLLTGLFLLTFAAVSPLYTSSDATAALTGFIAQSAALILSASGATAHAAANVLWTLRGGFLVTHECISTPLIPVYIAAVCAYAPSWRRLTLGLLAAIPLFILLGILRLLVVAVPATIIASPEFLVHAFYQLLLGAVVVGVAAHWRHKRDGAFRYAAAGIMAGTLSVLVLAPVYTRLVAFPSAALSEGPQGALMFLPGFQIGLYLALWVAALTTVHWRRPLGGLVVLAVSHAAGLFALHVMAAPPDLVTWVPAIRAWAVAGPVLVMAAVVASVQTRR
ncbi:MAG: hypothetical protein IPL75_03790 [Acidobacteria bacterium]|nr:hypothetical protein [Acidobacteriota bacterium]